MGDIPSGEMAGLPMIHSVRIQNFKNILDQEIALDRLTVFVGANGSGKTSVLEAIDLAVKAQTSSPNRRITPRHRFASVYTRGGSGDLSVSCVTEGGKFAAILDPPRPVSGAPGVSQEEPWRSFCPDGDAKSFKEAQDAAGPLVYLRLNAVRLAEPSYSNESRPRFEPDGGGAASVLAFMALNAPDAFAELMDHVRELLPQIKRIRFGKVPVVHTETEWVKPGTNNPIESVVKRIFQGEAILFDFTHATDIAAHTASEGTLMILGLLTVLLGPDRPRVLLLDDIEHGLHPLAQKQLLDVIGRIMQKFPELQIIATAHSPYLLNYLEPEQVRIMTADSEGHARCGKLTDHPEFPTWKDEMAPGEMWSLFGEKWLAGAEAAL